MTPNTELGDKERKTERLISVPETGVRGPLYIALQIINREERIQNGRVKEIHFKITAR